MRGKAFQAKIRATFVPTDFAVWPSVLALGKRLSGNARSAVQLPTRFSLDPLQHPEQLLILPCQPLIELHEPVHIGGVEAFAPGLNTNSLPHRRFGFLLLQKRHQFASDETGQPLCVWWVVFRIIAGSVVDPEIPAVITK